MQNHSKVQILKDSFFATVFTFLIVGFLALIVHWNTHLLNPLFEGFEDVDLNDLYYSEFKPAEFSNADTSIVLVNIGTKNREQLAEQIRLINAQDPKAIGLDIIFKERREDSSDAALQSALKSVKNLVMGFELNMNGDVHNIRHNEGEINRSNSYFIPPHAVQGFINLPASHAEGVVRYFLPFSKDNEGREHPSFSTALAAFADKSAYENLHKEHNELLGIRYQTSHVENDPHSQNETMNDEYSWPVIDAEETIEGNPKLAQIRNKIVILGYLGDDLDTKTLNDIHFTPLNKRYSGKSHPDMYGAAIHGHVLSTILNRIYITLSPKWILYVFSFLFCFVNMVWLLWMYVHKHIWFHLVAKTAHLILLLVVLYLGIYMYANGNIVLKQAILVTPLLLSVDALYFYEGLIQFLHKRFGISSYLAHTNH